MAKSTLVLFAMLRAEWIDAISKVSKELRKADVEPANTKVVPKTEGATVAKQGIKVVLLLVKFSSCKIHVFYTDYG